MPRYNEITPSGTAGQVENLPGHKRFDKYDLPSWCAHPLKLPPSQPVMLLFPGDQTHYPGMLASCLNLPAVQEMLELATEAFEFDVQRAFEECGPDDHADRTDRSQMLAYVADCVAFELLKSEQPEIAQRPRAVAGFCVGEFAALVAAGVMTFDQGLIVVKARGEAMQRWVDAEDMAALAVFGLEEDSLQDLCVQARHYKDGHLPLSKQQVYISHFWGRLGCVCSGPTGAIHELQKLIADDTRSTSQVYVQQLEHHCHAGHTPLAGSFSEEVAEAINSIPMNPPNCEVYFNLGHRVPAGEDPSVFLPYLLQQLVAPLRWNVVVQSSLQRGIRRFFEVGPGQSLKDLMIFNELKTVKENIRPHELTTNVCV